FVLMAGSGSESRAHLRGGYWIGFVGPRAGSRQGDRGSRLPADGQLIADAVHSWNGGGDVDRRLLDGFGRPFAGQHDDSVPAVDADHVGSSALVLGQSVG